MPLCALRSTSTRWVNRTVQKPGASWLLLLNEAFRRAMARLSPRYRELLLLKHWQGFSDREIGKMLSMSQGNVARTLQRAKEKLREALKEEGVEV